MSVAARALEMAIYEPGEQRKAFKVLLPQSLTGDLAMIAEIRDAVEKAIGDGTEWSPTRLLREGAEDLVAAQFLEWGGKPKNEKAVRELIEQLIAKNRPDSTSGSKR